MNHDHHAMMGSSTDLPPTEMDHSIHDNHVSSGEEHHSMSHMMSMAVSI